ncbi:MAG: excinuclease ABC subunit UvrA [Victivallales bacterium]|jgi:excinuclease ABC subunit A|nr:excinuclease ABC subunit UvrA [Victivallales bacterium]
MFEKIQIRGASQHNLKNIDVTIPRNKLVVITGLSGSGKSSLAFDTLYAEGQRRYVESLSAYARQFLDRMQKPKAEHIEGLSPAIAIEQRSAGGTPRSTVATVTEIYDYLRLLYAHVGVPHCPNCGRVLSSQSAEAIAKQLLALKPGSKMIILSPFVSGKKGEHRDVLETIRTEGFVRGRIDGKIVPLDDEELPQLKKTERHTIEAVVDRLITGKVDSSRLTDSVELALRHGKGTLTVLLEGEEAEFKEESFSENLACTHCGVSYGVLLPRNFSFNSPYGACPHCNGLGVQHIMDPVKVVPDPALSIKNGAIPGWRRGPRHLIMYYNLLLRKLAEWLNEPAMLTTPFKDLPEKTRNILLFGSGKEPLEFDYWMHGKKHRWSKPFEGILANMRRRMEETDSDSVRERLSQYLSPQECPVCHGARLNPVSLAVTVGDLGLDKFNALSVESAGKFVAELKLNKEQSVIAGDILKEIRSRLTFLSDVGLNYLTLNRVSGTLSGGEAQRIRLATQLGCGLVGVLYILDEPSIGLHQRDNDRLLDTLEKLRDIGNTVLVVEHDLDTILRADYVLDLGPGAGVRGGELVAYGSPSEIPAFPRSLTGDYLAGRRKIAVPETRNPGNGQLLRIHGAELNNLKKIDIDIPLGAFTCVTGVSGSGKSSLINGILVRVLNAHQGIQDLPPGKHIAIEGLKFIDKAIVIDQSPIGRTPRSNPATYTEAFGAIRKLFSELPESKVRGYGPGRFSFNVKGGRCEECKGDGIKKIEMQFLSDVYVECSACGGRRFNQETLNIRYKKKNIADVLDMTVNQAVDFFSAIPTLARKFKTLQEVGIGYIKLGQPATTLSGGEAQRIKLAAELARIPRGHTVYILDEPTTGLHLADIDQLLKVLHRLRDMGNTVIVIEHNLDVIKTADYIVDLGPEGGDCGGKVVACGTPEEVVQVKKSHTGRYLKKYLKS